MAAQGGDAAFIARHVEADVQRPGLRAMPAPTRRPSGDAPAQRGYARQPGGMRLGQRQGKEIGRAHVLTTVTTAQLVCRLMLDKKKILQYEQKKSINKTK